MQCTRSLHSLHSGLLSLRVLQKELPRYQIRRGRRGRTIL